MLTKDLQIARRANASLGATRAAFGAFPDHEGEEYLVIGHESLAEVVEVGSEVDHLVPGDLAVTMVRRAYPHPGCRPCRAGRQDFCATGDYTERGIKERHGFMTELVVDGGTVHGAGSHRAAEGRGVDRAAHDRPEGARGAVAGAGPASMDRSGRRPRGSWPRPPSAGAGRGAGGAARRDGAGCRRVRGARLLAPNAKADVVEAIGARYVSSVEHGLDALVEMAGRPEVVYEAAGVATVALETIRVLGPNGVFVLAGVPGPESLRPLDASALMRQLVLSNQLILGTVNAGHGTYEAAVASLPIFTARGPSRSRR